MKTVELGSKYMMCVVGIYVRTCKVTFALCTRP